MSNLKPHVSEPIPYDLLVDIFSRLPAKSIARFCCLSKSWAVILQSPYFTEMFLTRSLTRPRLLFTIQINDKFLFYSSPMPQNPPNDLSLVATRYHSTLGYSELVTCSFHYGLVCINDHLRKREDIARIIFNPTTGKSLPTMETNSSGSYNLLGYDPIGKQFKVLCMTGFNGMLHTYDEHRILTLETGKQMLWRMSKCKPHYPHFGEICINGVLYYRASVQQSNDMMIISFDVRSENFSFIKMDVNIIPHFRLTLINYKGKLGALHYKNRQEDIVLWVLEDVGEILWSQNCCFRPPLSFKDFSLWFVGMTVTGEFVFSQSFLANPFYVFYYNPEKNTWKKINIQGFTNQRCEEFRLCRLINSSCYIEDLKGM